MLNINPQIVVEIIIEASKLLMRYYSKRDISIMSKKDNSCVSNADLASNELISNSLTKIYPSIPIISEENNEGDNLKIIRNQSTFWLIDPIDGTWSFLNKSGDFVINVALIENGRSIFGVIGCPLKKEIYYNYQNKIYKLSDNSLDHVMPNTDFSAGYDFLISDINMNQSVQDFVNSYKIKTLTPISSAYKFALMCDGKGDIYPRFKPTYIWDTAAGHALLNCIGGDIFKTNLKSLRYNEKLLNPNFIAVINTNIPINAYN